MDNFKLVEAPANAITTDAIGATSFAPGAAVTVPFTATGTYTANTFTAQLSNSAGSFASPTTIGTLTSNASGNITATIPCNTTPGTGYRIRVVSDGPAITGSDNGTDLTVTAVLAMTAASQTNVACNGGATGAASVNAATGGAGGYSYDWTGAPTGDGTTSITGLSAQSYTCTVTDANSCTASRNFTITQPPVLALTAASQTNVACNGGTTGAASVNVATGGAGSYSYDWTPGTPSGDGTRSVTGLSAQAYTCTVTDANACTASRNFTITQPTVLALTAASQTNVACNGGTTGAASVNVATGGAGGYFYDWTPGTPSGDGTRSVTGLSAQTYTCTVTDGNSCTAQQSFTITQPPVLALTPASQTNVACNGGTTGAASVNTATGGAGSYSYDWTPGTPTGDGTTSISGLSAQTYTCTVTDANSCTAQQSFTITQPTALVLTAASQTNVACNGGTNGAASVNAATGGAGSYTYDWTPGTPTGDGTTSVTGLSAQAYTCTVTDGNGCTAQQSFTITQPTSLVLTAASQTNVSCSGGSDGAASVNAATGGAGSYTYDWTPGTPTGDGTVSISGLSAQSYTCTVTDGNGCTAQQSFTITQPAPVAFSGTSFANPSTCVSSDGSITLSGLSASTSYTVSYVKDGGSPQTPVIASDASGDVIITGLASGVYTNVFVSASGCNSATAGPFTLFVPDPTPPTVVTQDITVYLNAAGNATITGAMVDNGSSDNCGISSLSVSPNSFTCTEVGANTVTLTVNDINGNAATATAVVTIVDTIDPVAVAQNITVQLNSSGMVTVTGAMVNNGSSDACGVASLSVSPSSFTCANIGTNSVTLTVQDINGNIKTAAATVTVADTVDPIAVARNITVYLNSSGMVNITGAMVNNGSNDACGIASLSVSPNSFTCAHVGANNVTLTVQDLNGNTKTAAATVTVADTVDPVAVAQNITVQLNGSGMATISASAVNNGSSDACGIASLSVSPNSFTCAQVGANTVTLTVQDINGNTKTATAVVTVEDNTLPVITRNGSSSLTICQGSFYTDAGATASDNCSLAGAVNVNNPVNTAIPGSYTVTYTVSDVNGNAATPVTRTVVVNGVSAGSIGSDQLLLPGGDPAPFTQVSAASGSGTLGYVWESSLVSGSGFTAIAPPATSTTYDAPGGLTQTTYYRRVVTSTQNGVGCAAATNEVAASVGEPEIAVRNAGNTLDIVSGDNTPDAADGTLLGSLASGQVVTVSFTISNEAGTQPLNISDITLSNPGMTFFTIVSEPGSQIAAGATGTLVLRYTAVGSGIRSTTVTILSDDATEATYTFRVQGTAVAGICN